MRRAGKLDKLLDPSLREPDPEGRREIMRAISQRLVDNTWEVRLLHRPEWSLWQLT